MLNLLLNASAAAGPGGRIGLDVMRQGEGFVITVANGGAALPDGVRRVLETGEPPAPGGGVGLRVVVDAARRLDAAIRVATGSGGTSITLAVAQPSAQGKAA